LPSPSTQHKSENSRARDATVDQAIFCSICFKQLHRRTVSLIHLHRLLRYVMPHDAISRLAGGVHKGHQDQVGTRLFQAGNLLRCLRRNGGATAVSQTLQSMNQRSIDVPFACGADHPLRPPQPQGCDELGILRVSENNRTLL